MQHEGVLQMSKLLQSLLANNAKSGSSGEQPVVHEREAPQQSTKGNAIAVEDAVDLT